MKTLEELKQEIGLHIYGKLESLKDSDTYYGFVSWPGLEGSVVFGFNEDGMEHVSISHRNPRKLPTWNDMAKLKDMVFRPTEMAVQLHPPEKEYVHSVNGLENVLHLWRPIDGDFSILNTSEARWNGS